MKINNIKNGVNTILIALCAVFTFASCDYNNPDEPSMPDYSPDIKRTHSITELKKLYKTGGTVIKDAVIIKGKVSTDDIEGNFYKSLSIQDETGGIEIKLAGSNLGRLYPQGSTVVVYCKGLVLGQYGNQINLGYKAAEERYENAFIPEFQIPQTLKLMGLGKVSPRILTIDQLDKKYANTLVTIPEVQFVKSELGQTYADAANKEANKAINRTLIDKAGKTVIVRTSSYARFAGKRLPGGSGSITALLSYFGNTAQLYIVYEKDVELNEPRF
ncbi:Uncharacterised protein [Porphyromonas macacae]|uniref:DUF5689 domain-containing protein n=1 Tax=Porphyromonas macacae TaxID=28115 RepID=A0A379EAG1_9PORP|nr:DUF5689 domain-containing protein [Porphyromonas macacae]SUB89519.1 Uncharacterised protein [Porphyromonas macacae]